MSLWGNNNDTLEKITTDLNEVLKKWLLKSWSMDLDTQ